MATDKMATDKKEVSLMATARKTPQEEIAILTNKPIQGLDKAAYRSIEKWEEETEDQDQEYDLAVEKTEGELLCKKNGC
jgi:hypothetical protein